MSNFKPMLAATVTDRAQLRFPFLASPKLDGIRCIILNGEVLSRSLKPIRNRFIVSKLRDLPNMDGELIVGSSTAGEVLNRTTRGVMSADGEPSFLYHAFDTLANLSDPFVVRLGRALTIQHEYVSPVGHRLISELSQLNSYESALLELGYEGVMLRGSNNPYKCGRATASENSLWKLKQFADGELMVTHVLEGQSNENPATPDALGETTRSTRKENMVPNGKVGTICGYDLRTKAPMDLSPGKMSHALRAYFWKHPNNIVGRIVKYKAFNYGAVNAPRFATFQMFRHLDDMDTHLGK